MKTTISDSISRTLSRAAAEQPVYSPEINVSTWPGTYPNSESSALALPHL